MTGQYRVLVTGWRDWPEVDAHVIRRVLDGVRWQVGRRPIVIVQGECPYGGADLYAKQWAEMQLRLGVSNITVESHPAERDIAGRILGPERNGRMVAAGAAECLGFPGPNSRGTWDCLRKAVDANIPARVFPWVAEFAEQWRGER